MNEKELDPQTKELVDAVKKSINSTLDIIHNIDLKKVAENHISMEELKRKMGVK